MRFKLVSIKDTLLGHVDVPDDIGAHFKKTSYLRVPYLPPAKFLHTKNPSPLLSDLVVVTLSLAYYSQYRDALCIIEGTIEQLEKIPGYSFSPSMAYIRSLLEGA